MELKYVLLDINKLNDRDSVTEFVKNTGYFVMHDIDEFVKLIDKNEAKTQEAFLITDSRLSADKARKLNIGISVYINGNNSADDFKEALYCIENISTMSDFNIQRMYERSKNIPWKILTTKHTIVREITVDDVDELYSIYSDYETRQYIENLYEDREEEIRFTKDYIANQYRFYEYGMWVVIDKETKSLIGRAGVFLREYQDYAELGYVFSKEYWGKGIAYEVLTAILNYAKEELMMDNIIAHTVHENIRSEKILKKLGFEFDGVFIVEGKKYDRYFKHLS